MDTMVAPEPPPTRIAGPGEPVTLEAALRRIPPISPWATLLLTMSPDTEGSDRKLRELVASDPALLGRVLGAANSAAFNARGVEVDDVGHAIRRLGTREVWRIATVLALGASTRIRADLRPARRALWVHSFTVAHAARAVALRCGRDAPDPDRAFVAGLLHDVGLLSMLAIEPDRCAAVLAEASDPEVGFSADAEMRAGLPSHARFGGAILRRWGLPAPVVRIVGTHGRVHPLDQGVDDRGLAAALELGHQLAERVPAETLGIRRVPRRDDAPLLRTALRLGRGALDEIEDGLKRVGPRIAAVAAGA